MFRSNQFALIEDSLNKINTNTKSKIMMPLINSVQLYRKLLKFQHLSVLTECV